MTFPSRQLTQLRGNNGAIHALTYSSGLGTYLLSGAYRTICLWNPFPTSNSPHTTQLIQKYEAHGHEILDLAINDANSAFVSVGGDRQVFLWDVSTARTLRRWTGHGGRVNACQWGGEGDSIVVTGGYDATVRVWDVKGQGGKPIQVMEDAKDSVTSLCVRGWEIVSAGVDGKIRCYDLRMGMLRTDVVGYSITSLTLTKDGTAFLVSTLPLTEPEKKEARILLMDKISGTLLQTLSGHVNGTYRIRSTLAANDKYVLSGSEDGSCVAWDLSSANVVKRIEGGDGAKAVSSVAFCDKRNEWASAGGTGVVTVWGH